MGKWPNNVSNTTVIYNKHSAGGTHDGNLQAKGITFGAKAILSGELTANTYKLLVSVTGDGILNMCIARTLDDTSKTIGLKVVCDTSTAFDAVTDTLCYIGQGIVAVGDGYPVTFKNTLAIYVKSSLSETDKVALDVQYNLF